MPENTHMEAGTLSQLPSTGNKNTSHYYTYTMKTMSENITRNNFLKVLFL